MQFADWIKQIIEKPHAAPVEPAPKPQPATLTPIVANISCADFTHDQATIYQDSNPTRLLAETDKLFPGLLNLPRVFYVGLPEGPIQFFDRTVYALGDTKVGWRYNGQGNKKTYTLILLDYPNRIENGNVKLSSSSPKSPF